MSLRSKQTLPRPDLVIFTCDKCKRRFRDEKKFRTHLNLAYCDYPRLACPHCEYGPKLYRNEIKKHWKKNHTNVEFYCVDYFDRSRRLEY